MIINARSASDYILRLRDVSRRDGGRVGVKAANLGELAQPAPQCHRA
jgi:phosphoenolpyruvate synthase/pyruvate phosphate dikinase